MSLLTSYLQITLVVGLFYKRAIYFTKSIFARDHCGGGGTAHER